MDRTNDGVPKRPERSPDSPAVTVQVTPDNVVDLAVVFRKAAERLDFEVRELRQALRLREPWLRDPVSGWMWSLFNRYFVDHEISFVRVMEDVQRQHVANAEALTAAAVAYGRADELKAKLGG